MQQEGLGELQSCSPDPLAIWGRQGVWTAHSSLSSVPRTHEAGSVDSRQYRQLSSRLLGLCLRKQWLVASLPQLPDTLYIVPRDKYTAKVVAVGSP